MHLTNAFYNIVNKKDELSTALNIIKPTFQFNVTAGTYRKTYKIKYSEVIEAKKIIDSGGTYLKPLNKWMYDKKIINTPKEEIDAALESFSGGVKKFLPIEMDYGFFLTDVYFSFMTREVVFKFTIDDDTVGTSYEQTAMEGLLEVMSVIDYPVIALTRKGNYDFRFVTNYLKSGKSFREIAFDADEMESLYDHFQREKNSKQ